MAGNRTLVLSARPKAKLTEDVLSIVDLDVPEPGDGQILVRNHFASLDPGVRKTLGEASSYWVPSPLGTPLTANTVGEVVLSRHPDFRPGDFVVGTGAVQQMSAYTPGPMCWKIDPASDLPLSTSLGILGATGLTAYFGLSVGQPKQGETVLVSGAAGAVGSAAGQMAKIMGCRVVGLAGGPVKTRRVLDEFGFDAAIDYRGKSREELEKAIRDQCPGGVDLYFDNVGGLQLDAALATMNWKGRISVCGLISEYDSSTSPDPMANLFSIVGKMLRVEGFLCFAFAESFPQALREIGKWVEEGRLKFREHVGDGIESAPALFTTLFSGANEGKTIVRIHH